MPINSTVVAGLIASAALVHSVQAATVVVPDVAPNSFTFIGNGYASVTYDDVVFSQSAALGNPNLFNVGSNYVGDAIPSAVLSSQEETTGVANILISLPVYSDYISIDYGTFDAQLVSFTLSNGEMFSEPGTSSSYSTPGIFSVFASSPVDSILITDPYLLDVQSVTFTTVSAAPEPLTWMLMLLGIGGIGYAFRRAKKDRGFTFVRPLSV